MQELIVSSKRLGDKIVQIDDGDFELVSKYKWYISNSKAQPDKLYIYPTTGRPPLAMHRLIMGVTDTMLYVDHIDRNTLNNQRSNLRICSPSENQFNQGPHKRNTTGFKGVCFNSRTQKYIAQIAYKKKDIYGGLFDTPEQAALKYNELAKLYHGEFAFQNVVRQEHNG
jgi:hypothetical protein